MFFLHPRTRRISAGAVLIAAISATTGCKIPSLFSRNDPLPAPGTITTMPQVTNRDLDGTGRRLVSAGFKVIVKRPALHARNMQRPELKPVGLPEIIRTFQPSQWNHIIGGQDPAAGAPVGTGETVTLVAGIHHGAGPFRPWLDSHGLSVKLRGEQRCRDCHPQGYCSGCHTPLSVASDAK